MEAALSGTVPDPAELTDAEADALDLALTLDSGRLGERIADKAHDVAYRATTTPDDLRELAGMALALARRLDVTLANPDDD